MFPNLDMETLISLIRNISGFHMQVIIAASQVRRLELPPYFCPQYAPVPKLIFDTLKAVSPFLVA